MPKSHQEDNADIFVKNDSAILLNQEEISSSDLTNKVKETLNNKEKLNELSENIYKIMKKGAETKIAAIIWEIIK